jgi:hypothetical protein
MTPQSTLTEDAPLMDAPLAELLKKEQSLVTSLEVDSMSMELLVDGMYQHIRRKHGIDALDWRMGYGAVRRWREFIRVYQESKQQTLTTGSKQYNTKGWFYLNGQSVTNCCNMEQRLR